MLCVAALEAFTVNEMSIRVLDTASAINNVGGSRSMVVVFTVESEEYVADHPPVFHALNLK
jgi:hypothetical protein